MRQLKKFYKTSKILSINLIVTGGILLIPEVFLSKYFLNSPAFQIPEALVDHKNNFDVSVIEKSSKKINAIYSRDSDGYRPYKKGGEKTILTIGGSTTDQRFLDDKNTWQSIMEQNGNLSVINGGVDGQSSFGHLEAIKNWHSKALKKTKIDIVLFYIGVNDVRFSKSLDSAIGNMYDSPSLFRKIRSFFSRRSFFYQKLRQVKSKYNVLLGEKSINPEGFIITGHGIYNPTFLDYPKLSTVKLSTMKETREYRELFKELLITTKNTFKNAKVYIIQQQDPRCLITNQKVFSRTSQLLVDEHCAALASIYYVQDQIIYKLEKNDIKTNIQTIKMYEDNPIPDKGFYDGLHVNSKGAYYIGNYILDKL